MPNMTFTGFDPAAVALLPQLPQLDASDYDGVKDQLASGLRAPGAALMEAVAVQLGPKLTVGRASVSPLHRDLRFAKAGTPRYKDHLLLTTWEGKDRKTSPMLWLRIDAESVGFASGVMFTPATRERWRNAVGADSGATLAKHLAALEKKHRRHGFDIAGDQLARVPKPWPADHERADLLRRTGFQVRFMEPHPKRIDTPAFAAWCTQRLGELWPVHRWLVDHVAEGK